MERVSKEWLEGEIKFLTRMQTFGDEDSPDYSKDLSALTELLERREREDRLEDFDGDAISENNDVLLAKP